MNLKNNDMFMVEVGTHVRMGFNKVHEVAKRKKSHSGDSEIGHSRNLQSGDLQAILESRMASRNNAFPVCCLLV